MLEFRRLGDDRRLVARRQDGSGTSPTRCFVARMKKTRSDLNSSSWITAVAAYITSVKTVDDYRKRWNTDQYWDLPLPDLAEELVARWSCSRIINSNREAFGLRFKDAAPFTFDQINNVSLQRIFDRGDGSFDFRFVQKIMELIQK